MENWEQCITKTDDENKFNVTFDEDVIILSQTKKGIDYVIGTYESISQLLRYTESHGIVVTVDDCKEEGCR